MSEYLVQEFMATLKSAQVEAHSAPDVGEHPFARHQLTIGAEARDANQVVAPASSDNPPATAIELETLSKQFRGNARIMAEILSLLINQTPALIEQIAGAIAQPDQALVQKRAHLLKGRAATVSAVRLSGLCAELDNAARQGQRERFEPLLEKIQAEYRAVAAKVTDWLEENRDLGHTPETVGRQ